jgi:hypothetical protein
MSGEIGVGCGSTTPIGKSSAATPVRIGNSAPRYGVYSRMLCTALALISMCVELTNGQVAASEKDQRPVFTMSIGLKQSTVRPGSEVAIDVDLTNTSRKEIKILRVATGPPPYAFDVFDRNGKAASLTPLGEAVVSGKTCFKGKNGETRCLVGSGISSPRIAPGGTLHDVFVLSYYVDLTQPNQYTVRLKRTDPYTELVVDSNTLTITVAKQD